MILVDRIRSYKYGCITQLIHFIAIEIDIKKEIETLDIKNMFVALDIKNMINPLVYTSRHYGIFLCGIKKRSIIVKSC